MSEPRIVEPVGIRSALGLVRDREVLESHVTAAIGGVAGTPRETGGVGTIPYSSPWSSGELNQILADDVFPNGVPTNTRAAAMRIPTIKRGRGLLVNAAARYPLRLADRDGILEDQTPAAWLYRTNIMGVRQRIVWTVDDLIFSGVSCWWRDNGEDGFPLGVRRLNMGDWDIDGDLRVNVNGQPVPDNRVIVIPAYDEGILALGTEAIADTRALYEIVRDRLANPIPVTELHQVSGEELEENERDELLDSWRAARRRTGGTVGFTNRHIEAKFHGGEGDASLLIEARNAAAVDMARLVGISAGMVDATAPKASLNYETQSGRNAEFHDLDLSYYLGPIEDRLSLDDVTARGKRVVFDRSVDTTPEPSPTGATRED